MTIAIIIALFSLAVILYLDRLFTQRRSLMENSRYAERLHEGRKDSRLHTVGFENRAAKKVSRDGLFVGPEVEVRRPGFFSKRRVVTDVFGRVVATHYEELVVNDLQPRLMLTAGTGM
jgi:hypothetical protein